MNFLLTEVEAAELSKQLEEKWGLAARSSSTTGGAAAPAGEEKSEFSIFLRQQAIKN